MHCVKLFSAPSTLSWFISLPLPLTHPLLASPHTLLSQNASRPNKQRAKIPAQKPHILSLHTRHTQQILCVRQMSIQLRELSMKVRVLALLVDTYRR